MSEQGKRSTKVAESRDIGVGPSAEPTEGRGRLPAIIERAPPRARRRSRSRLPLLVALLITGAGLATSGQISSDRHATIPSAVTELAGSGRPLRLSGTLRGTRTHRLDERIGAHAMGNDTEQNCPAGREHDRVVAGQLCVEDEDCENDRC
jgi:hypothetical protein